MMTRDLFVYTCTKIIQEIRGEISITNQRSGYCAYYEERGLFGGEDYIDKFRAICDKNEAEYGFSLSDQTELIKRARVGHCKELSEYLAFKVIKFLQEKNVRAFVKIVASRKYDHGYVHVEIDLANEQFRSFWEIDAWDPRIIDISLTPEGTNKNEEKLAYGNKPIPISFFDTRTYLDRISSRHLAAVKPPEKSAPNRVVENKIAPAICYPDLTLDRAYDKENLGSHGQLTPRQSRSSWQ